MPRDPGRRKKKLAAFDITFENGRMGAGPRGNVFTENLTNYGIGNKGAITYVSVLVFLTT